MPADAMPAGANPGANRDRPMQPVPIPVPPGVNHTAGANPGANPGAADQQSNQPTSRPTDASRCCEPVRTGAPPSLDPNLVWTLGFAARLCSAIWVAFGARSRNFGGERGQS